jgi:exopolysaccharide biosynthesis protein
MLKRKKNVEIDLIELSKEEILENEKKIWGYSPEWRKRDVAADVDFIAKKNAAEANNEEASVLKEDKKLLGVKEAKEIKEETPKDLSKLEDLSRQSKDVKILQPNDKVEIIEIEDLNPRDLNAKDYNLNEEINEEIKEEQDILVDDDSEEDLADNFFDDIKSKKKSEKNLPDNKKLGAKKIFGRIGLCILTAVIIIVLALLGIVLIIEHGPSKAARNLFVNSVLETSAGKFLATTFVSAEVIDEIQSQNSIELTDEVTDSSLINVTSENVDTENTGTTTDEDGIELVEINGGSYNGYLLKIKDPSRVMVGTCGTFGGYGLHVDAIVERYGAVAGVNGGGFEDTNGMGNGGTPLGLVISNGKLLAGELDKTYDIAGFDSNNVLVVGSMTGQQAIDRGIRDCCCYGPTLIVNGVATTVYGTGSGINPRTAIGQCADGTVLLLVIDGRQINSIGATFADIIDVMLEYGAVNAYNLDGGSSTTLYYNGEYVNSTAPLTGSRLIPTAIIVK